MSKNKRRVLLIFWPLSIIIFLIASSSALLLASGYRVNLKTRSLQQTGIIYIVTNPSSANVILADKVIAQKTPTNISYLLPGRYRISIEAEGRRPWQKNVVVEEGRVTYLNNIVLWHSAIEFAPVSGELDYTPTANLIIEGRELWDKDILVTRLSEDITAAHKAFNHYFIATESKIYALEHNANTMELLINTPSPTQKLGINPRQRTLYWQDISGDDYQAIIY